MDAMLGLVLTYSGRGALMDAMLGLLLTQTHHFDNGVRHCVIKVPQCLGAGLRR